MPANYPPPRTPLPPHKLAKIANAFGVSSPLPHVSSFHRSETLSPSSASTASFGTPRTSSASKFLLHVIPPPHLPCNREDEDESNSSYGSDDDNVSVMTAQQQFRRGTLVPLQPTLQAQLGAIAREYSLPSTGGMMLFFLYPPTSPARPTSPTTPTQGTGPRITDHVWSSLWHRVLRTEREDSARSFLGVRSSLGLGSLPTFSRSSTIDGSHGIQTPSSTRSRSPAPSPFSTGPSSPPYQIASGLPAQMQYSSVNKSTPFLPSSSSQAPSPEPDYDPLTDFNLNLQNPESLIPVLAKVEFDIDRRSKAGAWYDPLRAQRAAKYRQRQAERQAKQPVRRKKFILPAKRDTLSERERTMAEEIERLRALVANSSMASRSNFDDNSYVPLDESAADDGSEYGSDSEGSDIDETEMFPTSIESNPVDKMFSDEAALRDIRRAKRESNAHLFFRGISASRMPKLKLDGAALVEDDEEEEEDCSKQAQQDEDEKVILTLLGQNTRASASSPSRSSNSDSTPQSHLTSSPRRHDKRPPPLDLTASSNRSTQLQTPTPISRSSESTSASSTRLPYLSSPNEQQETSSPSRDAHKTPGRQASNDSVNAAEVGSRLSAMEEIDDETWGDHASQGRSSRYSRSIGEEEETELDRKAKLDEIEKNIKQFSPRSSGIQPSDTSISTVLASDLSHSTSVVSDTNMTYTDGSMSEDVVSGPPRSSSFRPGEVASPLKEKLPPLPNRATPSSNRTTPSPTPPPLPLKSAMKPSRPPPSLPLPGKELPVPPLSHRQTTSSSSGTMIEISPSSRLRNELDWPPAPSPDRRSQIENGDGSPPDSPGYPISPDPFRRPDWSENPPVPPMSSRFSADSEFDQNSLSRASGGGTQRPRSNSIVSVKNIRSLWRKSGAQNDGGNSVPAIPGPPSAGAGESEPVPPLPAQFAAKHMKRQSVKTARPDSDADPFHFDQVKPYNIRPDSQVGDPIIIPSSSSSPVANAPNTGSVRKSILKSWKGNSSSNVPTSVQEIPTDSEKGKKRRPSVLDLATSSAKNMLKRNSRSSRSSVASASTINGAAALSSASRSTTPDPAVVLNDTQFTDGDPNLLSAGRPAHRPSPSGTETLLLKTPLRTNFDPPSPRMPVFAPQGSWI